MPTLLPTPCSSLQQGDLVLWPIRQHWCFVRVTHTWSDCCVFSSENSEFEGQFVVPREQWVAHLSMSSSKELSGAEQKEASQRYGGQVSLGTQLSEEAWLASSSLWHHPWIRMTLQGFSMGSILPEGATMTVVPVSSSELKVGQVVVWANSHRDWVAHRVIERRPHRGPCEWVVTQGDVRRSADSPVPLSQILGRVIQVEFQGQTWDPEHQMVRWKSSWMNRSTRWMRKILRRLPHSKVGQRD